MEMDRTSINKARSVYYGMFASLFAFNFNESHHDSIIAAVNVLAEHPMDEESGMALKAMIQQLEALTFEGLKNEGNQIFFSPTTSHVPMTASFYDEKRDDGKKRVAMMNYVLNSNYRRNTDIFKENEDHIEFIALFLKTLIEEEIKGQEYAQCLAREVFEQILNPMIDTLSEKVFNHENSLFYKNAAIVLRSFAEFERLFLNVSRPAVSAYDEIAGPDIKARKVKKPPRQLVERNVEEFVSI
ncbi:hypothetical protein FCL48_10805 [Desulforhopalus sp. IMCC35007]|nr:hypothetical protein FCL48_10805 [Desulforhopalus sp. IMCC35007]